MVHETSKSGYTRLTGKLLISQSGKIPGGHFI